MKECLFVGAGGFVGSIARYGLSVLANTLAVSPLWGTMAANILGSLLIGLFMATVKGDTYLFAAIGFCGGFTTFSTFSAQTLQQLQSGHYAIGLLYAVISVVICVVAVYLGFLIGKFFVKA